MENSFMDAVVRVWRGVFKVGNRTATPTPASGSLIAGTVTIESAGNSTNGKLEMEATTSGGTVRKLTIRPSQAMSADHTLTGLTALPGSTEMLTVTTTGQLGTATIPGGTVGGTGTDTYLVMWDGVGDIQVVPNWTGAGGVLTFDYAGDASAIVVANTGNTRIQIDNTATIYIGDSSGTLDTSLAWEAEGAMSIQGAGSGGGWRFKEAASNGGNYIEFVAPDSLSANSSYVLPSDTPSHGDQLTWNTGGTLSWEAAGGGGSGLTHGEVMARVAIGV